MSATSYLFHADVSVAVGPWRDALAYVAVPSAFWSETTTGPVKVAAAFAKNDTR
jgi:hypothetical protein